MLRYIYSIPHACTQWLYSHYSFPARECQLYFAILDTSARWQWVTQCFCVFFQASSPNKNQRMCLGRWLKLQGIPMICTAFSVQSLRPSRIDTNCSSHSSVLNYASTDQKTLPYCWWLINLANQLRLVVYPIIYGFLHHPRWLFGISSIKSLNTFQIFQKVVCVFQGNLSYYDTSGGWLSYSLIPNFPCNHPGFVG